MTSLENNLALYLIKENYGETARLIASHLITKKSYPLMMIAEDLNLETKLVSQILAVLITHSIAEYRLNARQMVEYRINTKNILNLIKIPRYIQIGKNLHGIHGAIIVEELLVHGSLEMSSVILKTLSKSFDQEQKTAILSDPTIINETFSKIKEVFIKLVEDNFIDQLPKIAEEQEDVQTNSAKKSKIPKFITSELLRYSIPEIKIDESRRKKVVENGPDLIANKIRNINENFGDSGVYWRVNEKRFFQYFRDEAIAKAIENRIDKNAGNIMRAMLKIGNGQIIYDKAVQNSHISKPVTAIDLQKEMRIEHKMEPNIVDKYLNAIAQDSFRVLEKIGDFSGGAYNIDYKKSLNNLCIAHIESYVREKYGSKSLRIFRVIMDKIQLEQKQIEDFSMIPSKDCKTLLYNMVNDGLLGITELSKTSDHAPSRTYYLFYIDIHNICKRLLENAYHGYMNLIIKREHLSAENKRLLEKNKKVNAIMEMLKLQGADQAEIDDVKQMMSAEDLNLLGSVNGHCDKIELAEIQLQETIFIFENYFYYHTVTPIITTGRGAASKQQ